MRYSDINDLLLRRFPMLKDGYERLVRRHMNINEQPGAHVVYGDLFCDYVIALARRADRGSKELRKAAEFIEEMAQSEDREVRNLAELSVLERLIDQKINAVIPLLGSRSAKLVKSIGERLHLDPGWERFGQ